MCTSCYFVCFQEYLLSMVGCYYLWKVETGTRDIKQYWINECLRHEKNINTLHKNGLTQLSSDIKPIYIHEDVNFQWKTWMDASKFWEKEIYTDSFSEIFAVHRETLPEKKNYFHLWFIFKDRLSWVILHPKTTTKFREGRRGHPFKFLVNHLHFPKVSWQLQGLGTSSYNCIAK